MGFMRKRYRKDYAANSRETIRRQTIHQFEQARLVDRNPDDPFSANEQREQLLLSDRCRVGSLEDLRNGADFENSVVKFVQKFGQLEKAYNKRRDLQKVKLELPTGATIRLFARQTQRIASGGGGGVRAAIRTRC